MTSQISYTETKRTSILPLIKNTLKRRWTTMLLIGIIMFFVIPVPIMMMYSSDADYYSRNPENLILDYSSWANYIRYAIVPIMSVLAVIVCCVMLGYLHKKISVDFYHSLPIKRGKLFASQLISGYIILLVPTIIMFAVGLATITFYGAMTFDTFIMSLLTLGEGIIYSLLFYALSSVIGVVTGLTAVHLILTGVAIFIVPLIYCVSVVFLEIFTDNMWSSWYFGDGILTKLSPVIRFLVDSTRLSIPEIIIFVAVTVLLFVAARYICLNYKSERAENSVIFPILGEIIKYLLVFPMTLAGGLLFYYIMYNGFWTIFGMVCGGLLTFMLTNTILQKSAKAMFCKIKGLAVYAGVMLVAMILIMNNLFGINSNISKNLNKVEIIFDDNTYMFTFKEEDTVNAIRELYEKGKIYDYYMYDPDYEIIPTYTYASYTELDLSIVFYPSFGIPQAKEVTIYRKNECADILKTILDSEEFSQQYKTMTECIDISNYSSLFSCYCDYLGKETFEPVSFSFSTDPTNKPSSDTMVNALIADTENVKFDSFQQLLLGNFRMYVNRANNTQYVFIPFTANMTNTLEAIKETGISNITVGEYMNDFSNSVVDMEVFDLHDGTSKKYTNTKDIYNILQSLSVLGADRYDSSMICQLTLVEPNYVVHYSVEWENEVGDTVLYEYVGMLRLGTAEVLN